MAEHVQICDTTLRDCRQGDQATLSAEDKLKMPRKLDDFGGAQLKMSGSPSTYTTAGSVRFVSAASYFGVSFIEGEEFMSAPYRKTLWPMSTSTRRLSATVAGCWFPTFRVKATLPTRLGNRVQCTGQDRIEGPPGNLVHDRCVGKYHRGKLEGAGRQYQYKLSRERNGTNTMDTIQVHKEETSAAHSRSAGNLRRALQ
jgi:hypothetical protein